MDIIDIASSAEVYWNAKKQKWERPAGVDKTKKGRA
jgi:hypothetical protein